MGGTDASVFAIEGVPTLGFTTEDFKGYDFDTRNLAYGTGFIHKEHPRIPRTYGYGYRYHSPRCSESG